MVREGRREGGRNDGDWRESISPDFGSETPDGVACGSEASPRPSRCGGWDARARATWRPRWWLGRKLGAESGKTCACRTPAARLRQERRKVAGAASRGREHDLEREPSAGNPHAGFDERGEETWSRWRMRHRHDGESRRRTAIPSTLDKRASPRLYRSEGVWEAVAADYARW